jgi:hypothetical protein
MTGGIEEGRRLRRARDRDVDVPVVVAAVFVVVLVAVIVAFSLRGTTNAPTHADACRSEVVRVQVAVAEYRARHPARPAPTAAQLVSDGRLVVPPLLHAIGYAGTPPTLRLRPLAGSGC